MVIETTRISIDSIYKGCGYAIQLVGIDGHTTGIDPFGYSKRLVAE